MIIWSGRGILSILFVIACVFLFTVLFVLLFPEEYNIHGLSLGFVSGGWLTWYLGSQWNAEEFFYKESENQMYRSKNNHTLFWIPMQYVGVLFVGLGVLISLTKHVWIGLAVAMLAIVMMGYKKIKYRIIGDVSTHQVTKESKVPSVEKQSQSATSSSWEKRPESEDPTRFMPK